MSRCPVCFDDYKNEKKEEMKSETDTEGKKKIDRQAKREEE